MLRDDEIKLGLRTAGIPGAVIATTLAKENAQYLRDMVTGHSLTSKGAGRGLFLYPMARVSPQRVRTLFYLVAKELFLYGTSVYCIPLSRLFDAITSFDYEGDALMVDKSTHIFVLDFYEDGSPFPMTPEQAAKIRAWVRGKFEKGGQVSFLSDSSLTACGAWWPSSFTGYITDNCIVTGAV